MGAVDFAATSNSVSSIMVSDGLDLAVAAARADQMVSTLPNVAQAAVRETIARSIEEGWSIPQTVKELQGSIGLTAGYVRALGNYEKGLKARQLAPGKVKQMVAKYKDRLTKQRARTVARTQVTSALNQGRYTDWGNRIHTGALSGGKMVEWVTTPDDRLCEMCSPLSGLKVPYGQPFSTSTGSVLHPPLHPNCRCTVMLV